MFDVAGVGLGDLLPFIMVGFVAQMIDGALGMAFGVISNTLLISLGVPPATASAIVHTIKNFTGAVSAVSHIAHRNVDWRLFWRLVIPGVIGGVPFVDVIKSNEPLCGRLNPDKLALLFGGQSSNAASVALLPLAGVGLLAVGSSDANRFFPGMGTLFLRLMGESLVAALKRYA